MPGDKAVIQSDGVALVPAEAPLQVQAMIAAGNRLIHFDYQWGGGHANPALSDSQTNPQPQGGSQPGDNGYSGYDCSGATSYVIWGGGFGQSVLGGTPLDSTGLESVGDPGPGKWVTWYATGGHAYIEVAGMWPMSEHRDCSASLAGAAPQRGAVAGGAQDLALRSKCCLRTWQAKAVVVEHRGELPQGRLRRREHCTIAK